MKMLLAGFHLMCGPSVLTDFSVSTPVMSHRSVLPSYQVAAFNYVADMCGRQQPFSDMKKTLNQ